MHENEKLKWSHSVVSNSLQPHGLQPIRLLCPWDFSGKSTEVGCHSLLYMQQQQNEHSSSKQRNPSHNSVAILIKVSSFLALPAPPHPPLHTLASMCLSAVTVTVPPPEPEGPKKHFGPLLWHVSPLILQVLHTCFTAAWDLSNLRTSWKRRQLASLQVMGSECGSCSGHPLQQGKFNPA